MHKKTKENSWEVDKTFILLQIWISENSQGIKEKSLKINVSISGSGATTYGNNVSSHWMMETCTVNNFASKDLSHEFVGNMTPFLFLFYFFIIFFRSEDDSKYSIVNGSKAIPTQQARNHFQVLMKCKKSLLKFPPLRAEGRTSQSAWGPPFAVSRGPRWGVRGWGRGLGFEILPNWLSRCSASEWEPLA